MTDSHGHPTDATPDATVRQQLIEHTQLQCHQARSTVQQAKLLDGSVPRNLALRLQQRIVDYYYALKPLRNEAPVDDWWDSVQLSENWIKDVRTERQPVVTGDYQGRQPVGVQYEQTKVVDYYEGLDQLERLDSMTETKTVTKSTLRGVREETTTRQKALDPAILIDITATLDDAATRLGFSPDVEAETPHDDTDLEDLARAAPLATLPTDDQPDLADYNVDVDGAPTTGGGA